MGLDNAIMLKVNILNKDIKVPKCFNHEEWYEPGKYKVCYWRKCWGVRDKIITEVFKRKRFSDEYVFEIVPDDVIKIIKILKYYDNKKNWDRDNSTIWWYKEDKIHKQIRKQIKCLKKLYSFLRKHQKKDIVCYFYDSY
jgi:hypothetical protein